MISRRSSLVKRSLKFVLVSILATGSAGCHCMPMTERYCDHVDNFADHEISLDKHYRPVFDVTRWGMWNGPECCRGNNCRTSNCR